MRFFLMLLLPLLAACAADPAGPSVQSGKTYDQLVAERGTPSKSWDIPGGRMVEYESPGCMARFWIFSNHVQQVTYDGDDAACKNMGRR